MSAFENLPAYDLPIPGLVRYGLGDSGGYDVATIWSVYPEDPTAVTICLQSSPLEVTTEEFERDVVERALAGEPVEAKLGRISAHLYTAWHRHASAEMLYLSFADPDEARLAGGETYYAFHRNDVSAFMATSWHHLSKYPDPVRDSVNLDELISQLTVDDPTV